MRSALAVPILLWACNQPPREPPPQATPPPAQACPESKIVVLPCDDEPQPNTTDAKGEDTLTLVAATFADLPGWADDRHAEALVAFVASCTKIAALKDDEPLGASAYGGRARDWRAACAAAAQVPPGDDAAARAFFEAEFAPYQSNGKNGPEGKLSGYYVQAARGSRTRHGKFQTPLLARPADLVSIELGDFIPDGRARRIWGRFDAATGKVVPYATRAELRRRPLADQDVVIWLDDPVDAIFAEIQGSARVTLDDGAVVWLAFAGKNGHTFRGVGGILRKLGELEQGEGTMQGIRAWFAAHPDRFDEIADLNPAKVFFEISDRAGAIGRQDVVLTARRSMAVDRAVIALSTPVWVETRAPTSASGGVGPWRHLVVAQDTGGAILGPIRGDIYWGDDAEAAEIAGRMGGPGRMWLLLPRALDLPH
jgi:membrane-bound lytic murein transglycosylase A